MRGILGTVLALPVVIAVLGSSWSVPRRDLVPVSAQLVTPPPQEHFREVHLSPLAEGAPFYEERSFSLKGGALEVALPRPLRRFHLALQAEPDSSFRVLALRESDGVAHARHLWEVRPADGKGASTRHSGLLRLKAPIERLRIEPVGASGHSRVSGLRIQVPPRTLPHWALVPAVWILAAGLLLGGSGPGAVGTLSRRLLSGWARVDLPLASILVFSVCFRAPLAVWVAGGLLLAIGGLIALLRHAPLPTLAIAASLGVLALVAPAAVTRIIVARIAQTHELTIDHRMKPDPARDINPDGIRSRETADSFTEDDFVVMLLGDSFTYGEFLAYEETYPFQLERLLGNRTCTRRVRVLNAGWTSASPLLALRLLREIGYKYEPDLVVYNLDMTDFHDDLYYAERLQEEGDLSIDPSRVLDHFVKTRMPWLDLELVASSEAVTPRGTTRHEDFRVESDRFFATNQPLEMTRPYIRRGVVRNLEKIHRFALDSLGARMALVVYPRSFQYSDRESPRNWESGLYTVMGQYAREPFRFFDEIRGSLPYPVIDLLPAFEATREFPLFLEDDPHWNARGARFTARASSRALIELGMLPCD